MNSLNQQLAPSQYTYKEQNPEYKGEPLDASLADGPAEDRKCTDVLCCLLYLAFWAGLIVIAVIAFKQGNPQLLAAPFDSSGTQCGFGNSKDTPYIYYNQYNSSQFCCINQCPMANTTAYAVCKLNGITFACSQFGSYNTSQVVDICYPQAFSVDDYVGFMETSIADLQITWPIQLSVLFMALVSSILLMIMFRHCGGCIIWTVIILYFVILTAFGIVCFEMSRNSTFADEITKNSTLRNPKNLLNIAIVSWTIDGLSFLIFLCCFKKIRVAVVILKAASDFTRQEWKTIFVPLLMFLSIGLFISFWVIVSIYLFSSGHVKSCGNSPYGCIDWNVGVKRCLGFYFFGLFWNCQFAIAMCQFVIASTASFWYFGHLNKIPLHSPILRSFGRAFFYHSGSLAFGSLVLCILFILQLILQFFHWMTKDHTVSGNPVENACFKCFLDCSRCCLACFERFVRFISKNAFIMMAITGSGFCTSAHEAFYLVVRTSSEYAVTHGIGHIIMFFGKLLITALCTFSGYLMIVNIHEYSNSIFSPFMPTLLFFVISFVIATLFMDVFGIGSDTILLCYALQMDINRGMTKSCPPALKEFFDSYK